MVKIMENLIKMDDLGGIIIFWKHPFTTGSFHSKKSPTGPAERTPKPEYLIAPATYLGVRW